MPKLRIHGIAEESIVDGPGLRYVVFTQGCPHNCPGCHNPETHDPAGGRTVSTEALLAGFLANPLLAGITFSGGEPFEQPGPLAELARQVRRHGKSVIVYSGYTLEHLHARAQKETAVNDLLEQADTLIDGPYVHSLRDLELDYRGSANQRLLDRQTIQRMRSALAEAGPA